VIILSARGSEDDRVRGLRGGADDYVVKPFSARELLARVDAVLRRSPEDPPRWPVSRRGTVVDFARREVLYSQDQRTMLLTWRRRYCGVWLLTLVGRSHVRSSLLRLGNPRRKRRGRGNRHAHNRLRNKLTPQESPDSVEWIITVRARATCWARPQGDHRACVPGDRRMTASGHGKRNAVIGFALVTALISRA